MRCSCIITRAATGRCLLSGARASHNLLRNDIKELEIIVGFYQVNIRTKLKCPVTVLWSCATSENDERHILVAMVCADCLNELITVHSRHFDINECKRHIACSPRQDIECLNPIPGKFDVI